MTTQTLKVSLTDLFHLFSNYWVVALTFSLFFFFFDFLVKLDRCVTQPILEEMRCRCVHVHIFFGVLLKTKSAWIQKVKNQMKDIVRRTVELYNIKPDRCIAGTKRSAVQESRVKLI